MHPKEIIKQQTLETIDANYRHKRLPQTMLARITKGGKIVNLKILDENENEDIRFAEIPDIPTLQVWESGDIVIVSFLYGKIELPVIIRKWEKCH